MVCFQIALYTSSLVKSVVAGNAFTKAAQTSLDLGSKHEAATQYVDAGNCYRKGDPNGNIYYLWSYVIAAVVLLCFFVY